MYIYELKEWPKFFWDQERIGTLLADLRLAQGKLMGRMESIGFPLREEAVLETLTFDVVKSSEIEGEFLDQTQVRSSVARKLGMESGGDTFDQHINGVVEMVVNATQKFQEPLTKERLFSWHKALFPTGYSGYKRIRIGSWRTGIVQVVSGRPGHEKIHFEGPPAENVEKEMEQLLDWINEEKNLDFVLKSAIAHFWFVTIHPFDDGNGRIGRAIADHLLAKSEKALAASIASLHRFSGREKSIMSI